jgi:hypothetical protein
LLHVVAAQDATCIALHPGRRGLRLLDDMGELMRE